MWELRVAGRSRRFVGTPKEAEKALSAWSAVIGGRTTKTSITLEQLLDQWRATRTVAEATGDRYDFALKKLPPSMLRKAVDKLTLRDFDLLFADLADRGTSPQDIKKLHTAVSSALTQAMRWGIIDQHPARGASVPTIQTRRARVPNDDELARLQTALLDDLQGHVWFRLALAAGARRAEVLALRWSDIDFTAGTMRIDESLTRKRVRTPTKTRVERTFTLDANTLGLLEVWKSAQVLRAKSAKVRLAADPCVLSNAVDSSVPWAPNSASQRWRRLRERAEIPDVRLNDLRHANASIMLSNGVSPAAAAARLGNSEAVILRTYSHVIPGDDQRAAATIGKALG